MIEPFGYLGILFQLLEIFTLIGFLVLFFLERSTYGRDSIGHDSWPRVLLYNLLTGGAYGIYWRLKVTYALSSRDRFSSWQWILVLTLIFVINFTASIIIMLLRIWDFVIGRRLTKATGQQYSWVWTFIFGHLYLASFVEREAGLLPRDFRVPRPEKRSRIVKICSAVAVGALAVMALSYWGLVEHRKKEFAQIPAEALERIGHWHETHERYENIYFENKRGQRDVYTLIKSHRTKSNAEWMRYTLDTKFHDGNFYTYNWFTCLRKYQVIEMKPGQLVLKNSESRTLIENRIETEAFTDEREKITSNELVDRGWEWGTLLKSPWTCELAFIKQTWDQSLSHLMDKGISMRSFLEKT